MRLALYQPDIPQNCGAAIRLCACLGVPLELIGPFGFVWDEARVKRVAMDYLDHAQLTRHASWADFCTAFPHSRLVLLTTKGAAKYTDVKYHQDDILLLGSESSGVPENIHQSASLRVFIPMAPPTRSLNVVLAGGIVLGEALRQIQIL